MSKVIISKMQAEFDEDNNLFAQLLSPIVVDTMEEAKRLIDSTAYDAKVFHDVPFNVSTLDQERARITSLTPPAATRSTRLSISMSCGPMPSMGEMRPPST